MSDSPPPTRPKPGSLRDRIAAFEQKPAAAAAPPAPRPKPGNLSKWAPKPADSPLPSNDPPARASGTSMNASDAKASIGAGGSLKERMAALQGIGAFGASAPAERPRPPTADKPKWKPPPQVQLPPPIDEDGGDLLPASFTPPVGAPSEQPPVQPSAVAEEEPVVAKSEDEEGVVDPEEEERQRRAAIAARMARLGGARVGMGPPVFGKKPVPPPKKPSLDESSGTDSSLTKETEPSAAGGGAATASEPASDVRVSIDQTTAATSAESLTSPSSISPKMPVPAAPRRAAPPRRKTPKAPEPTPTQAEPLPPQTAADQPADAPTVVPISAEPITVAGSDVFKEGLPESAHITEEAPTAEVPAESSDNRDEPSVVPAVHREDPVERPRSASSDPRPESPELDLENIHSTRNLTEQPSVEHAAVDEQQSSPGDAAITPDETEDEHRKRIAERVAKMGGFNPLSVPPPLEDPIPESAVSAKEHSSAQHVEASVNVGGPPAESGSPLQDAIKGHDDESVDEIAHERDEVAGEESQLEREVEESSHAVNLSVPSPPPLIGRGSQGQDEDEGDEGEYDGPDEGTAEDISDIAAGQAYIPLASAPQSARPQPLASASSSVYSPPPKRTSFPPPRRPAPRANEEGADELLLQDEPEDAGDSTLEQFDDTPPLPPPPRQPTLSPPPKRSSLPPSRVPPLPSTAEALLALQPQNLDEQYKDTEEQVVRAPPSQDDLHNDPEAIGSASSSLSSPPAVARDEIEFKSGVPPPPPPARKPSVPPGWIPSAPSALQPMAGRRMSTNLSNPQSPPPILTTRPPASTRRSIDERQPLASPPPRPPIPSSRPPSGTQQIIAGGGSTFAPSPPLSVKSLPRRSIDEGYTAYPSVPSAALARPPIPAGINSTLSHGPPPPSTNASSLLAQDILLAAGSSAANAEEGDNREVMDDSDGDPIDPRFHSPPPKSLPLRTQSPPAPPATSSQSTVLESPTEDPEQAQRRTIAERMARLGGIRFGAPPPVPSVRRPQAPPATAEDASADNEAPQYEAEPTTVLEEDSAPQADEDDEDEQARRARITARLAASGGMRFGMLPGQAPPPPPPPPPVVRRQTEDDMTHREEPKSYPIRAVAPVPPSHAAPPPPLYSAPPPPPLQTVLPSQHQPALDSDHEPEGTNKLTDDTRIDPAEAQYTEPEEYAEDEGEVPPPPPRPTTRPPVPRTTRKASEDTIPQPHSRRVSSDTTATLPTSTTGHTHASEYVMVDDGSAPPTRPSRGPPPSRAAPVQPSMSLVESSQWELPSIPSGGLELSDMGTQSDLSESAFSEDSTTYPPTDTTSPPKPAPSAPRPIPAEMSTDDLTAVWGRVGVLIAEVANQLLERSKRSLVGNGSYIGFVNAVLAQVPQARAPQAGADFGFLIYVQAGATVQTRASDIMPGDIVVLEDARFKGHKGLHNYSLSVGEGSPCLGIVTDFDIKKVKIKALQANQHVGQATVESVSYRLEDLKSGSVKIYRVLEG